jgi:type I site-specific restriction endonuclease
MDKRELSERDICTKFITPALRRAGWDEQTQRRADRRGIKAAKLKRLPIAVPPLREQQPHRRQGQ